MFRRYVMMRKLIIYAFVFFSVTGCATIRYIPNASPPPDLGLRRASSDLEVHLYYVISPDGPGSWVKQAKWNEFVLGIRNLTQSDVRIERIDLVDLRGVYVESLHASMYQLESQSERLAKQSKDHAAGSLLNTAIIYGRSALSMGGGPPGLNALGSLVPMISLIGQYLQAQDGESIEAEFRKRRLPTPTDLVGRASLTGSVFFPHGLQPQTLVITYRTSKGEGQIKLSLF